LGNFDDRGSQQQQTTSPLECTVVLFLMLFPPLNYRSKEGLAKYSFGLAKPKLFEKKKSQDFCLKRL
jgi:hypothetical protein